MKRKAITLTELLIAVSLMATIILAAASFDTASSTFLKSSERRVTLMNELTLILDYLHKDVETDSGWIGDGWQSDPTMTRMNGMSAISSDGHGNTTSATQESIFFFQDNNTPSNFSDNTRVTYTFYSSTVSNATSHVTSGFVTRQVGAGSAARLTNRYIGSGTPASYDNCCFTLSSLGLRYDTSLPVDNGTNPEVYANNVVLCAPGRSGQ